MGKLLAQVLLRVRFPIQPDDLQRVVGLCVLVWRLSVLRKLSCSECLACPNQSFTKRGHVSVLKVGGDPVLEGDMKGLLFKWELPLLAITLDHVPKRNG